MNVAIVKYNAGNVQSVKNALVRLGVKPMLTSDPEELVQADKVVFPGVGEASSAMKYLKVKGLDTVIRDLTRPVLAICLGMQLLGSRSEENDSECLGILPFRTRRFKTANVKVPHMGWNNISGLRTPLFNGVEDGSRVYFVHSYFVERDENSTAVAHYETEFSAALSYRNFHAVQFHPEKSGRTGAKILENFLEL
jgi:glutamine amidotransferase